MDKIQNLKESAKLMGKISEDVFAILEGLNEPTVINFETIEQYEQLQLLVKEGYVKKDFRKYSNTELAKGLLEAKQLKGKDKKKFEKLIQEDVAGKEYIKISFKNHDFDTDTICNEVAKFELDKDGLPIVVVNEEVYAKLIHRTEGQHWKQYLGEDGRQLIRQKKLQRFYVENEKTGRRYLYIV